MLEHSKYMAVLSAKIQIFPGRQQFARLFMYKMKSSGPRTENRVGHHKLWIVNFILYCLFPHIVIYCLGRFLLNFSEYL